MGSMNVARSVFTAAAAVHDLSCGAALQLPGFGVMCCLNTTHKLVNTEAMFAATFGAAAGASAASWGTGVDLLRMQSDVAFTQASIVLME